MRTDVVKLVGFLVAGFPYAQVSKETQRVYAQALSDVPTEILTVAIEQCVAECEFFPTVAKVREKIAQIETPQRATPADAWGEVVTAMKQVGFYGRPEFDDPLIRRIVFAMDWQALCSSENTIADRAHFMKMYEQMVEREKSETKLLPGTVAMREQITNGRRPKLLQDATNAEAHRRGPDRI